MSIFDHTPPKITEVITNSTELASTCKKISSFYQFILDIQLILEFRDKSSHTNFAHAHQKSFQ